MTPGDLAICWCLRQQERAPVKEILSQSSLQTWWTWSHSESPQVHERGCGTEEAALNSGSFSGHFNPKNGSFLLSVILELSSPHNSGGPGKNCLGHKDRQHQSVMTGLSGWQSLGEFPKAWCLGSILHGFWLQDRPSVQFSHSKVRPKMFY